MNILLLDGSPKAQNSASAYYLKALEGMLGGNTITWRSARGDDPNAVAEQILAMDALVVAFPLYVDGIPSHLLAFLEELEQRLGRHKAYVPVYALCNAGFYEARQTQLALDMMKLWCEKAGLRWGKAIGIGAGGMAMAAPVGQGPFANLGREFAALTDCIQRQVAAEDSFVEPGFPRFLYKSMAHQGWRAQAKKNGVRGLLKQRHPYP